MHSKQHPLVSALFITGLVLFACGCTGLYRFAVHLEDSYLDINSSADMRQNLSSSNNLGVVDNDAPMVTNSSSSY